MKITMFDQNEAVCAALKQEFGDLEEFEILNCDLGHVPSKDALVIAGNAFGVMSDGIDLEVRNMYGIALQDGLQGYIGQTFPTGVPIGAAVVVSLEGDETFSRLIYAPTMYVPSKAVDNEILYASIAAFMEIEDSWDVAMPAFGTGCGEMPANKAARIMRIGYETAQAMKG